MFSPSTKAFPPRLSKTWQSSNHHKNSLIHSKPDRAHICTITYGASRSRAGMGDQVVHGVGSWEWAGDACTMASSAKSYLESTLLLARVTKFPQQHLADSVSSFDRGLVDIVHEYDYLQSRMDLEAQVKSIEEQLRVSGFPCRVELEAWVRTLQEIITSVIVEQEKSFWSLKANKAKVAILHDEEVVGLKGQIVELKDEVKHVNDEFSVTFESNSRNYARVALYKAEKEKLMENFPLLFKSFSSLY
ncbi:hypothetical protein Tco_1031267 [Tanacetum coccineum]|uniref:Uncharacterized protein n=1 Tax=Tanacetum coccineum TaxID=301880 RepID=A0ABQ5G9V9_9ASTR